MLRRVALFAALFSSLALAQRPSILVTVADENGVAVAGAAVAISITPSITCTTDVGGRCHLSAPAASYTITASKPGFYQSILRDVRLSDSDHLAITLTHTREVRESIEVRESPPEIDPQQVAATRSVDNEQIVNIPFPVTRDIRQMLPYIPGVVRDNIGQTHIDGAETYRTLTLLDGFLISDPETGFLDTRFSTDAVRAIDVQSSRYSAEYGPGSGGVMAFTSVSGDDRFRFSATNFVPSLQFKQGTQLDKVTPRIIFSGPIVKGRAWFLLAPEGEYDNNIVTELPKGQNRNPVWRLSNLAKLQVKVTPSNVLTASFLVNDQHSSYTGISLTTPPESTLNDAYSLYVASVRDQIYLGGAVIDAGVAISRYHDRALPLGTLPYTISPGIVHGNFYRSLWLGSGRVEPQLNISLPRYHLHGSHELRFGAVARDITEDATNLRTPITLLRADQTLYSRIVFTNPGPWRLSNTLYGAYVEDRWAASEHVLVEAGLRFERDSAMRQTTFSPRIAATWMLSASTKLSAGIGLFHDYPTLDTLSRPLDGPRTQYTYDATGTTVIAPPVVATFIAPRVAVHSPAARNWSIGLEHQFAGNLFVSADFIDRHVSHDFAFDYLAVSPTLIQFTLGNNRTSQYRAIQLAARRVFHGEHELMLAYTRSTAHTTAALGYSIDNPVFSPQSPGPLAWDAPNKIVSWGFFPAPHFKKWSFGYSAEWHTGFPYTAFNQFQQVVGGVNSHRFTDFVMINPFLEWRFSFRKYNLALRGGFENVTGSKNPFVVQNNIDAANFGQFSVTAHRAFVARIRFLGRK